MKIGTELEAAAARTIAERGVQLIGTAHGTTLENLMMNPTLSDLIGGIQSVTLGDDEARRRGTQKSILERKAPPTFEIVVEIVDWQHVSLHKDVGATVDSILRAQPLPAEIRFRDDGGVVHSEQAKPQTSRPARKEEEPPIELSKGTRPPAIAGMTRIYPYGVSVSKLDQAIKELKVPALISRDPNDADLILTLRSYYRKKPQPLTDAESASMPVYVLRSNAVLAIENSLANIFDIEVDMTTSPDPFNLAMQEAEQAINQVMTTSKPVELQPQSAYVRRLQHQIIEKANLVSKSRGREPHRRVRVSKSDME